MNTQDLKKLSIKSLVGMACQEWGSNESWTAIAELQMRGSPETLSIVRRFANERSWRKRALGLYIASQLRQRSKSKLSFDSVEYALLETQVLLLNGLSDEHDEVIRAAISGLSHRPHPNALPYLVKYANHQDHGVRLDVAIALGRYPDAESVETLIKLAGDEYDIVRDWATFSLGSMLDVDNENVRECLWKNLTDSDEDVNGEALVGLAIRKDERVIPILLERLNKECRVYELHAAEELASPALLKCLNELKNAVNVDADLDTYWYNRLLDAINACAGEKNATPT